MINNDFEEGFGERLKQERKRLGMTQESLAERVGVKPLTVLQYEKGNTSPALQFIYKLQGLGFNLQYLLFNREKAVYQRDFPPEIIKYVADEVSEVEKKFAGGTLTNETRLKMMLILLEQYAEQPSTVPLTDSQALSLLQRS